MTRVDIREPAQIIRDKDGIPHIFADSELDLVFLQGYTHARDRLFQMDMLRRTAEGTVAELLGQGKVADDIILRTFGVRRSAERTLPQLSRDTRALLESYANGVNAYLSAHALPPEYRTLELTRVRPWTALDTVTVGKLLAFQLAFDIVDVEQSNVLEEALLAGDLNGFDGEALYFEDIARVAPFDSASTIPDSLQRPRPPRPHHHGRNTDARALSRDALRMGLEFASAVRRSPHASAAVKARDNERGSNAYVVAGRYSRTGEPLLAGDPHLSLTTPSQFEEMQLEAPSAGIDVIGMTLPGVPYVVFGNTKKISWSGTNNDLDVTDIYQERIVRDATSPSGLSSVYRGTREHVVPLPQQYLYNNINNGARDDLSATPNPAPVLIVPRRNQGPLISFNSTTGEALSVQYAGFSPTRELEAFRSLARARKLSDFTRAIENLDVGSQNFVYADVDGNIAYFMSGEVPLREDLQAGRIAGLPPMFVRNGEGGNEWLPARSNDPTRSLPYEILPQAEMPRVINPPRGFIVTANNDPTGATLDNDAFDQRRANGGILYFGSMFSDGVRADRIDDLLADKIRRGRIDADDLTEIQADTVMGEARVFTPYILQAFANARRSGSNATLARAAADPRVVEAVGRLAAWDQTTPTGIPQGYDANDRPGRLNTPSSTEIRHSVAATIYSVWRNQFLTRVIVDTVSRAGGRPINTGRRDLLSAARNLLDSFNENMGIGASGVDFFEVPGINDARARRDYIILSSLAAALDKLAGNPYADAFRRSTRQDDYRWGILHRVVLTHPLGAPFETPPAGGAFPAPLGPRLPGIPVDGGLLSVDVGNNVLLQDSIFAFTITAGPVRRYVAQVKKHGKGIDAEISFPGGISGVLGAPFSLNMLERWLTNEMVPLRQGRVELFGCASSSELFLPLRSRHRADLELPMGA